MAFICRRCALRLQKASQSSGLANVTRSFSASATRKQTHGVPKFAASSNPELELALTEMRNHYIIPAYLPDRERRMIYDPSFKQSLEDFPQTYRIGDEDIPLLWTDKLTEVASRRAIINNVLRLLREGDKGEWDNLPSFLEGIKKSVDVAGALVAEKVDFAKVVRLAALAQRMDVVIQCLGQVERTGMTLGDENVLREVLWGLRTVPQQNKWSRAATKKALVHAKRIAAFLEMGRHRATVLSSQSNLKDGRVRPEVIGVFLELVAVQAHQHQEGKDVDGSVRAYAERLLSTNVELRTPSSEPASLGPQIQMQQSLPIYHGLNLAQKILGANMPRRDVAKRVLEAHRTALATLATGIEARNPRPSSYDHAALTAWNNCIRD